MNNKIEFKLLAACPEYIPSLTTFWYEGISQHWVPESSVEKAADKLRLHLNTETLPTATVAIYKGTPVGMACLRDTDGIRPGVTPWLGSLVVDPVFQGNKIGEALINRIKLQAKSFGYDTLYLLAFDPTIPEWYSRLGWSSIGQDVLLGHRVEVMSIGI